MDLNRITHSIILFFLFNGTRRANYIRRKKLFYRIGENCMIQFYKLPLYPRLISFGDNVRIASNVTFITHDVIHNMFNNMENVTKYSENVRCIEIGDNVFVGANTIILPDVKIGSNIVIGAGSIVNKDILDSGVYVGTPVKYICTIDKLKDKRKENPLLEYNKGSLANESVDNLWKTFLQKRKQ